MEAKTLAIEGCSSSILYAAPKPPTVKSITPNTGGTGTLVYVPKLSGSRFAQGATVRLTKAGEPDIYATNVKVPYSTRITCTIELTGASFGAWNVVVTNPDGGTGILPDGFTVTSAPSIVSITPNNAGSGNPNVEITDLSGTNFSEGVKVKLAMGRRTVDAKNVVFVSQTKLTCSLDLTDAFPAPWDVVVTNPDGGKATLPNGFTVNQPPRVTSITPRSAGTGNPDVSITRLSGYRFAAGATVKLKRSGQADINATNVSVRSSGWITCSLDLTNAEPGAWDVQVTNPDGGTGTLSNGFTVTPNPTVTSITPNNAGSGNPSVLITDLSGANFLSGATVKLTRGAHTINAKNVDVVSTARITCTFNLTDAQAGLWSVVVTNIDGGSGTLRNGFRVNPAPNVTSITPNNARSGNPNVSITRLAGSRFVSGATVRLTRSGEPDINATNVKVVSSVRITCTLDLTTAKPGPWDVVVTNPDGGTGVLPNGFTVTPGPTVLSITPNSAQTGTSNLPVDIRGTNFALGATVRLTMGGQADIYAKNVRVVSSTEVTCALDLGSAQPGAWNVVVANTDGGSGSLGGGFTVAPPPAPTVLSITPDRSGKTVVPVTVMGTNFASGATVTLVMNGQADRNASSVRVVSSSEITCTLDLLSAQAGAWDVRVTNPDGQSGTLPGGFTVVPPATIASITPDNAGSGASLVFISDLKGENLENTSSVKLTMNGQVDVDASNIDVLSPTDLTCTFDLSSAVPGSRDVVVTDYYGGMGVLPGGFTVNPPPIPASITPNNAGSGNESFSCLVTGTGFAEGATAELTMSGQTGIEAGNVTVASLTELTCTFDLRGAQPGVWDLLITNPDGGRASLPEGFTVNPAPTVASITPNVGAQGQTIDITELAGTDFISGAAVKLAMSGQTDIYATNVDVVSSSVITCTLGLSNAAPGSWDVVVINPDGGVGILPEGFTVNPAPAVVSITPNSGIQGQTVDITELAGTDFVSGAAVKLTMSGQTDIEAIYVKVQPPTNITCTLDLSNAAAGLWNVLVINPDGGTGVLENGFTVNSIPSVTSIEVIPDFKAVEHGSSFQFDAKGYDADGREVPIDPSWSCDPEVGTIDSSGLFSASGWGTCDVTASVGQVTGTSTVSVPSVLSGTLTEDTTLTKRRNPWILLDTLTVPQGITLYVEAGVVIKAQSVYGPARIDVQGSLSVTGSETDKVRMTSFKDDNVYGDTNSDGGSSTPSPSDWEGIVVKQGAAVANIDFAKLSFPRAGVTVEGSSPTITNSAFSDTSSYGVVVLSGTPDISSNTFERCLGGVSVSSANPPVHAEITSNTINDSVDTAIVLANASPNEVSGNHGSRNAVNGIAVSGTYTEAATWNATNTGLPYVMSGAGLTIPEGVTLTVQPGVVMKSFFFDYPGEFVIVGGVLLSNGTEAEPVTFTSIHDDSVWGDTDNNGVTVGTPGDWGGLTLECADTASTLTWTNIRYGGFRSEQRKLPGLKITAGPHVIDHCSVIDSGLGGAILIKEGTSSVTNSTIGGSVYIEGGEPSVTDCDISKGGITTSSPLSPVIERNHIHHSPSTFAVQVLSGSPKVGNNPIDHCAAGISVSSAYPVPLSPVISGNAIDDCPGPAVSLGNASTDRVTDNHGVRNAINGISVSGTYMAGMTWNASNTGLPYVMAGGGLTVPQGVTLTLDAGVVMKSYFFDYPGEFVIVGGVIVSNGTALNPVTFTSIHEDLPGWGDTDYGLGQGDPQPGDWGGLTLQCPGEQSRLSGTNIRYGGFKNDYRSLPGLKVKDGPHLLEGCRVTNMGQAGAVLIENGATTITDKSWIEGKVEITGGSPTISDSWVTSGGITTSSPGSPTFSDCHILSSSSRGLWVKAGTPTITGNEVSGSSGAAIDLGERQPALLSDNYGEHNQINGIVVSGTYASSYAWNATNTGLPFVMYGAGLYVSEGATLTILPGTVVKGLFASESQQTGELLHVDGHLVCSGAPGSPVTFTSVSDDFVWGDTNNDDDASSAYPGEAGSVIVDGDDNCPFAYVDFSYGGFDGPVGALPALLIERGYHEIRDCNFKLTGGNGAITELTGSTHIFSNPLIQGGIRIRGEGTHTIDNNPRIEGGIDITASGDNIVTANQLFGTGVFIDAQGSSNVSDNDVTDGPGGVTAASGSFNIMRNGITGCAQGISVCKGSEPLTASVSSNTIEACGTGISVSGCDRIDPGTMSSISTNQINNCTAFSGLISAGLENLDIHGNYGSGSRCNGLEIGPVGSITQNVRLQGNDIPYTLTMGSLSISPGATLSADPGVVFKSMNGSAVTLSPGAALAADDCSFTSAFDDSLGGKTVNPPWTDQNPGMNDWAGIAAPTGSSISLQGATLAYGSILLSLGDGVSMGEVSGLHLTNGTYDKQSGTHTASGGLGIQFNGESATTIKNSTLEWCDKAVVINLKEFHEGEVYPAISDNDRLWDSNFGIYVLGAISEQHLPINAINNYWCNPLSVGPERGPQEGGPGSQIGASFVPTSIVDIINFFPYAFHHSPYKVDVNDVSEPSVGIYLTNSKWSATPMALMRNAFKDNGVRILHYRIGAGEGETLSNQRCLRNWDNRAVYDSRLGTDYYTFDDCDFAWVNGHGALAPDNYTGSMSCGPIHSQICFDDYDFYPEHDNPMPGAQDLWSNDIQWGDNDLEWVVLDGCSMLARDNQVDSRFGGEHGYDGIQGVNPTTKIDESNLRWYVDVDDLDRRLKPGTINQGLHMLLGHAMVSNHGDVICEQFAVDILGTKNPDGTYSSALPIADAYLTLNGRYQPYDQRLEDVSKDPDEDWRTNSVYQYGCLSVVYYATECRNEHFWGRQNDQQADPVGSDTNIDTSSPDEYTEHHKFQPGNLVQDIGAIRPIPGDSQQEQANPYVVCRGHLKAFVSDPVPTWYTSGCAFPGPFDDAQDGGMVSRGILAEFKLLNDDGTLSDEPPIPVDCTHENSETFSTRVQVDTSSLTVGEKYKVRFFNRRTWYWGYLPEPLEVIHSQD